MPVDCGVWCLLSERRRHVEKLWRLRTIQSADEKRARRRFNRLLRAFDLEDLDAILKSVQSGGRDIKQCAPGPPMDILEDTPGCSKDTVEGEGDDEGDASNEGSTRHRQDTGNTGLIPQIDKPMSMPYLCCKLWRWKELQVDAALHRLEPLPWCRFGRITMNNATVSCCNPFHYALWIIADPCTSPEDESPTSDANGMLPVGEMSFTNDTGYGDELTATTMGNNHLPPSRSPPPVPDSAILSPIKKPSNTNVKEWGRMFRWRGKERMDEHGVSLHGAFVAVGILADAVYDGQNVCIEWDIKNEVSFALIRQTDQEHSYDEIWLYNSGHKPLFISVSSAATAQDAETIRRVSSGYCYRVHKFGTMTPPLTRSTRSAPANTRAFLNISVGKGWGTNYHRTNHIDTPCRYEVAF